MFQINYRKVISFEGKFRRILHARTEPVGPRPYVMPGIRHRCKNTGQNLEWKKLRKIIIIIKIRIKKKKKQIVVIMFDEKPK